MCIGFLGKIIDNSNTKFKLQIKDVVEVLENKGIKLVKHIKIYPEEYTGLDLKLDNCKNKESLTPNAYLKYKNSKGEPSIKFIDYNYITQRDIEEESVMEEVPLERMNMEVILEEKFAVDLVIEKPKEKSYSNINKLLEFKGCKLGNLD